MKYFFDTEFIENGKTIDLISLGIVCEDGRERYYENSDCDHSLASPWVKENVLPYLMGGACSVPRAEIGVRLVAFVGPDPEFWAYYADYDWVAMCQIYGTMMDLPDGWPMICYDLRQWLDFNGHRDIKQPDNSVHVAIDDARWVATTAKKHFRSVS